MNDWTEITIGSNWKNRKTGMACIVILSPNHRNGFVSLLHQSGRRTQKQVHYFLYDFEIAKEN